MHLKHFLAASVAVISVTAAATPACAQETTSAIRGTIADQANGQPISGATVTVRHVPSGTVQRSTSGADGGFTANGLRIGGPYEVVVEAPGFEQTQVTDLELQAGNAYRLPILLREEAAIMVTGSALSGATDSSTGPFTALGREEIEGVASVNRDVRDLARRDPFVTLDPTNSRTIEIAGQNGRNNRFSVDGVGIGDDFGLNNGGLPTNRGPVPLGAIEQFSVKVAPYDITEGNFTGGSINVVLRSGSNRFRGSGFFAYTDDNLTGDRTKGQDLTLDFDSKVYGGYLTGPIVKDKLFFMVSYEKTEESTPFDSGPGASFAAPIPNLTVAQVDNISALAQSVYGYDTLGFLANDNESDEKIVGKLDWNISDRHRAALTYFRSTGDRSFQRNTRTSNTSPSLGLTSTGYQLTEEINSGVFQLNSSWTDRFSTEVRASYRDYNRGQIPFGEKTLGEISVCLDPVAVGSATGCSVGTPRVVFGPDRFRHANKLNTDNLNVEFKATLDAGDHSFKLLSGYNNLDVFNLFVFDSLGTFFFDSVADFQAGRAGELRLQNAVPSLDPNDGAATFSSQTFTVGLQDDWQVTPDFAVTLGMRYDLMASSDRPVNNSNFFDRTGFSNRTTFNGKGVLQPRFGFKWDTTDRLKIRGGAGIFAGGSPNVFLSNSFSNTGQLTNAIRILRDATCNTPGTLCDAALNVSTLGSFSPIVTSFLATNTASLAAAPVNAIDPNLKLARKLRVTLSGDYEADLGFLGDGWNFGANILYDRALQSYTWVDLRSVQVGTLPDGRPRFNVNPLTPGSTNQDLLMTNATKGRSWIGVVRFDKSFGRSLDIGGSYTRSDVTDVNGNTSATAMSLFTANAMVGNGAVLGRSINEIKDQYKFNIAFREDFFGDNTTRINIFGEYRSGRPFSLTFREQGGGRGQVAGLTAVSGRGLLYIPTLNDTKVSFDSVASETAFNTLVADLGLEKFRGQILPKNSQTSPDFFKVDLNVSQEVPLFAAKSKLTLFADVENVLNFIDSDWGSLRQVPFNFNQAIVQAECLAAPATTGTAGTRTTSTNQTCAQFRYSGVRAPNVALQSRVSLYGIRVGVRISF